MLALLRQGRKTRNFKDFRRLTGREALTRGSHLHFVLAEINFNTADEAQIVYRDGTCLETAQAW